MTSGPRWIAVAKGKAPMTLEKIAPGIHAFGYTANGFPCRSTLVDTGDGLLLVSPGPVSDELAEEIAGVGEVRGILAPCLFHHIYAAAAASRFTEAKLWAAPGFAEHVEDSTFSTVPTAGTFGSDIEVLALEGAPRSNEVVLLHRPSRSLITTDLVMNMSEGALQVRILLTLFRAWGRPRTSQLWRFLTKDRAAIGRGLETILSWDFDRLVVNHGAVIETGGKDTFADATGWLRALGGVARLPAST